MKLIFRIGIFKEVTMQNAATVVLFSYLGFNHYKNQRKYINVLSKSSISIQILENGKYRILAFW